MAVGKQSPQSSLPPFALKGINTTTWGSTANTCTITDAYIHPNSVVLAYVTGSTPAAGRWSYTITQGQVVISSSDAESSTLPVSYIVL
jgi:hypothetical protein